MSNKNEILNIMSTHIADELELLRESKNKNEILEKGDVLFNLHKIICNYDEVIEILNNDRKNKRQNIER